MTYAVVFLAGLFFGVLIGAAASRSAIGQRQAARRDLAAELRGAVDLEPCEFTGFWQERG